jgi:hypothetical protein
MKIRSAALCIVVLSAVTLVLDGCRNVDNSNKLPDYNIRIIVPLADSAKFQPDTFMEAFRKQWKQRVGCAPIAKEAGDTSHSTTFSLVSDTARGNIVWLAWSPFPLDTQVTALLIKAALVGFTDNQRPSPGEVEALRTHKAALEVNYELGTVPPKERIVFTARTLLTIFSMASAVGYVDASAQSYRSAANLQHLAATDSLSLAGLFEMFVNMQVVTDSRGADIHTHGMDQFWLPDIQMVLPDTNHLYDNYDVIRTTAAYLIDKGDIVKAGDVVHPPGLNTAFDVVRPAQERDHPFGSRGVIGLQRQK